MSSTKIAWLALALLQLDGVPDPLANRFLEEIEEFEKTFFRFVHHALLLYGMEMEMLDIHAEDVWDGKYDFSAMIAPIEAAKKSCESLCTTEEIFETLISKSFEVAKVDFLYFSQYFEFIEDFDEILRYLLNIKMDYDKSFDESVLYDPYHPEKWTEMPEDLKAIWPLLNKFIESASNMASDLSLASELKFQKNN